MIARRRSRFGSSGICVSPQARQANQGRLLPAVGSDSFQSIAGYPGKAPDESSSCSRSEGSGYRCGKGIGRLRADRPLLRPAGRIPAAAPLRLCL